MRVLQKVDKPPKGKRCGQVRATRDCELLIWVADDERAIRTLHIASPGHWHDVHARTKWDKRRQKVRDPSGRAAETGLRAIDICAQDNAIHTFQPRCLDVLSAAERVGHWHDFHAEARGNKRTTKGGSQVRAAKTGLRAMYNGPQGQCSTSRSRSGRSMCRAAGEQVPRYIV